MADLDARRIRAFTIRYDSLLGIFNGRVRLEGPNLPEDAQVVKVFVNPSLLDEITLFMRSRLFAVVPEGEPVPSSDGMLKLISMPDGAAERIKDLKVEFHNKLEQVFEAYQGEVSETWRTKPPLA